MPLSNGDRLKRSNFHFFFNKTFNFLLATTPARYPSSLLIECIAMVIRVVVVVVVVIISDDKTEITYHTLIVAKKKDNQ